MRLLMGSNSPIMSSCNTVMSPCRASSQICSKMHNFPLPGWWGIPHHGCPKSCMHKPGPIPHLPVPGGQQCI